MSFDKVKAMRDAERFLTQGKIRAAISEYKRVVEFDKTDFNTLNMLGDLYVKASETDEAVKCFNQVAEHYSMQGFAQKAIAIYNKILRLKPDSMEVSAKLAQLYQSKGSYAEARNHYTILAEQYTKKGRKAEALSIWKQIANLDPYNTDIYFKIAEACWQDQQKDEAANAYTEAGNRLTKKNQFESAITAYSRALEIRPDDLPALRGFVKSQIGLGSPDEATRTLETSFARQPNNREITNLLTDCYIESGKVVEAEKTVVKLVEQEPTQYPKLLEVFQAYIKARDVNSASRILTMASEHMLVGGRAIELEQKINEIFDIDSENLDAIRLLVRFESWQRDESGIKTAFEKLAEAAKNNNSVEDEIYALSQLVMIAPQNVYFAQRLQELNLANGTGYKENPHITNSGNSDVPTFESYQALTDEETSSPENENGFEIKEEFQVFRENSLSFEEETPKAEEIQSTEDSVETAGEFKTLTEFEKHGLQNEIEGIDFYIEQGFYDLAEKTLDEIESRYGNQPEIKGLRELLPKDTATESDQKTTQNQIVEDFQPQEVENAETDRAEEVVGTEQDLETVENVEFQNSETVEEIGTVENELENPEEFVENEIVQNEENEVVETSAEAEESIASPETEFVESNETIEPNNSLESVELPEPEVAEDSLPSTVEEVSDETNPEQTEQQIESFAEEVEPDSFLSEESEVEQTKEFVAEDEVAEISDPSELRETQPPLINPFEEMKSELSSPEPEPAETQNELYDDAFETSYQTGIVYREMGLMEESIREFQDAIKRVTPNDGTRRFFLCCNMLGLCFMEKQMPTIAIMWLKQGLDCNHLSEFELNGMRYELAHAYEKAGDMEKAQRLFEEIYAIDVSFRDVGKRLQDLIAA